MLSYMDVSSMKVRLLALKILTIARWLFNGSRVTLILELNLNRNSDEHCQRTDQIYHGILTTESQC